MIFRKRTQPFKMSAMRAACYARFSSDLQRETSIDDQIRVAREYATRRGWTVLDAQIYTDAALSGASLDRPGVKALLQSASHQPAPFDVLLVDDSSRVSRDLPDAVRFLQTLKFAGVRVIYISQGIDSLAEEAETLAAFRGLIDSAYLRDLAKKVKRGLIGQLERGYSTGARTYGYRTVPVPDPSGRTEHGVPVPLGHRVEIDQDQARLVHQIFELFADGFGIARIVERLNAEGAVYRSGRRWKAGAVRRVLDNPKYCGMLIWGKTTQERRPGTRQHVQRYIPRDQWRTLDRPDLRIIDADLWERVRLRHEAVRATIPPDLQQRRRLMRGKDPVLFSHHLFSGFLTCAVCGGAMTAVTGGHGSPRYGCPQSWRNGLGACTNRLTIRAKIADAALLNAMRRELLAPATVRYLADALADALHSQADDRPRALAATQAARAHAAERLQRLIVAIQQGVSASSVAGAIAEREHELRRLDEELIQLAEPLPRLAVIPTWVESQLRDVAGLLRDTPERTKVEFQRLGLRVSMQPIVDEGPRPFYRANGRAALPSLVGPVNLRGSGASGTDFAAKTEASTMHRSGSSDLREIFAGIPEENPQLSTMHRSDPPATP
jgi:site-specific DNA recombinase